MSTISANQENVDIDMDAMEPNTPPAAAPRILVDTPPSNNKTAKPHEVKAKAKRVEFLKHQAAQGVTPRQDLAARVAMDLNNSDIKQQQRANQKIREAYEAAQREELASLLDAMQVDEEDIGAPDMGPEKEAENESQEADGAMESVAQRLDEMEL